MTSRFLSLAALLLVVSTSGAMAQKHIVAVEFGDDSGEYPRDDECDDPRFTGPGMATAGISQDSVMKDATDCEAAYKAGTVRLVRTREQSSVAECATIDFGDNHSEWANDNECDDPRFTGGAVDEILLPEDERADANDCRALCLSGDIWLREAP